MKKINYTVFFIFVLLINLFGYVSYPREVMATSTYGESLTGKKVDHIAEMAMLTDYLFINTPKVGDIVTPEPNYQGSKTLNNYDVLEAYETKSGLDAFILLDQQGKIILSIRGTEGYANDGDLVTDSKLVLGVNQQYEDMKEILKESKYTGQIDIVMGHSLGGSTAINTALWLEDTNRANLDEAIIFSPAPMIDDEHVNSEAVLKLNKKLTLSAFDNEILLNFVNKLANKAPGSKALNPYGYFDYYTIQAEGDMNPSFTNHYIDKLIPVLLGEINGGYHYHDHIVD